MNRTPFPIIAGLLVLPAFGYTQSPSPDAPPKPRAPYVAAPRPGTTWQVDVRFEGASTDPHKDTGKVTQKLPVSILTQCDTDLTYTVVTWSDGSKSEAYIVGNRYFQKPSPNGKIYALPAQDQDFQLPLFTAGYPGAAWVDAPAFQRVETVGKQETFKYSSRFTDRRADSADGDNVVKLDAWIDTKSGVPARVTIGKMIYEFGPVREAPSHVVLPPDFKEFLDRAERQQKALNWIRRGSRAAAATPARP